MATLKRTQHLPILAKAMRGMIVLTGILLVLIVAAPTIGRLLRAHELAYLSESRLSPYKEQIRLMDIERNLTVAVTDKFSDISTRLQWTPDGQSLFFGGDHGEGSDVYHLNLETRQLSRLLKIDDNNTTRIADVALSPDGKRIAALRSGIYDNRIYIMSADDSQQSPFTVAVGTVNSLLNWSPDSQSLVYTALSPGYSVPELWQLDLSTPDIKLNVLMEQRSEMGMMQPRWSADGHQILMLGVPVDPNVPQPYISLDIATGEIRQILDDGSITRNADWSQDGTKLVYQLRTLSPSRQSGLESIFLLDVASGESRRALDMPIVTTIADIQWSDDETLLAVTAVGASGPSAYVLVIRLADGQIMRSTNRTDRITGIERGPAWRP